MAMNHECGGGQKGLDLGTPSQGPATTPIRPLTAAYRAVSSDYSVSTDICCHLGRFTISYIV